MIKELPDSTIYPASVPLSEKGSKVQFTKSPSKISNQTLRNLQQAPSTQMHKGRGTLSMMNFTNNQNPTSQAMGSRH